MTAAPERAQVTGWDWFGVALLTASGVLAGLLETLLVPLYVGSTVFPVAIVMSLVSNVLLPWLARLLVPTTVGVLLPFGGWLLAVLVFGAAGRPEGDVILPGSPNSLSYVTYGVIIGGFVAGVATVIWLTAPRPA
ncbi:MAG: hypothetical protein QOH89_3708 [Pseudonocardiales bacterium]|nr:hypothetical protein [Pseudonocardiales bacterium]